MLKEFGYEQCKTIVVPFLFGLKLFEDIGSFSHECACSYQIL
jgi:hypothetical protein